MRMGLAEAMFSQHKSFWLFAIFGRTDLRMGISGTKLHEDTDVDVENRLAPPISRKNYEKLILENQKNRILSECFIRPFGGRLAS